MGSFSDAAFSQDAFSVDAFSFGTPVPPTPTTATGGGGGWVYDRRKRRHFKSPKELIEDAFNVPEELQEIYEEIAPEPLAAAVVAPFQRAAGIDWDSLRADADAARSLIAVYAEQHRKREISDDDDDILMMVH